MKVFKPLQASLLHKTFEFKGKKQLAVSLLFGFPFEGNEPLLEPDLWKFIATEIGKNGILDMGMPKPNGEVLVYGNYFAPNGVPVKADAVRLKMGTIDKALLVYGNRYWRPLLGPSEPEPVRELPLDYAHAFGGKGFAKNPSGKGMVEVDVFGEKRRPLPNIEHPDHVMTSSGQQPDPAGFGPLDLAWEFRAAKLGTYDDKWLAERWPAYADDLDWNHFNAAPPDQWLEGFFSGTESFALYNMHPDKPIVRGQLPPFRARCFIQRASSANEHIDEINMRTETVWLFPHAEMGVVLYRGVIGIQTDDASDVKNVIAGYENLSDEPRTVGHYANQLEDRQAGLYELNTTGLIPTGATCGYGALEEPEEELGFAFDADASAESAKQSRREELTALSEKLAAVPGAEAAKAKVDQSILDLDLPPLFPRPSGYERINELRAERHKLREALGGSVPEIDIEDAHARLEEAGREMKEGYRAQAHLQEEGRPAHEKQLEIVRQELFERLENKKSVAGWDLAGLNLSNQDLSGVDFSGCYLEKVDFTDSKLIGTNLEGAILAFANLTRCDLSGANLKRANLGAANLWNAVVEGADLTEAILGRAELWSARLTNCNMQDVDLFETSLADGDFNGSDLSHTRFADLHMARAKFQKSILKGSTFISCNLDESDFSEAVLDESTWVESILTGANFSGAQMTNCRFPGGISLAGARFTRALLNSSNLRESDLREADFTEASLDMCDLGDSDARNARFTRATAKRAKFIGADLGGADLSSMNLMEATLKKARLTSATLRNANCYEVDFKNATVGGTDFTNAILYRTLLEKWRPS